MSYSPGTVNRRILLGIMEKGDSYLFATHYQADLFHNYARRYGGKTKQLTSPAGCRVWLVREPDRSRIEPLSVENKKELGIRSDLEIPVRRKYSRYTVSVEALRNLGRLDFVSFSKAEAFCAAARRHGLKVSRREMRGGLHRVTKEAA